jgi:hypothetical protein
VNLCTPRYFSLRRGASLAMHLEASRRAIASVRSQTFPSRRAVLSARSAALDLFWLSLSGMDLSAAIASRTITVDTLPFCEGRVSFNFVSFCERRHHQIPADQGECGGVAGASCLPSSRGTGKPKDIARGDTRICSQRIFETAPQYVERDAQRFHIS